MDFPARICAALFILIAGGLIAGGHPLRAQTWTTLTTGSDSNLRGISAARIPSSDHIAIWAGGSHGVILRSVDDGKTWTHLSVPGQHDLDFRGIVAFSDQTAYIMASGEGEKSRIYKTYDGGAHWDLQFTGNNKATFLDSIACFSATICLALGDPVEGKFLILKTNDGAHWSALPLQDLPTALPKEGAFAASNSNLLVNSENELVMITGGFAARLLHTTDGGRSWQAAIVPVASENAASGIFSIARSPENQLVAVGGDYTTPTAALRVAAVSADGGKSWQPAAVQPSGYRSAVVALGEQVLLCAGPTGSDISKDTGIHWNSVSTMPLNALFAIDRQHIYGAGPKGVIVQFGAIDSQ